jgi:hypothetical protein
VAGAWTHHWRQLWPAQHPSRASLEALIRAMERQRSLLAQLPDTAFSRDALRSLERRLQLAFRRNPLSPTAAVAYLGLLALDLRRVRGALATRALREEPAVA